MQIGRRVRMACDERVADGVRQFLRKRSHVRATRIEMTNHVFDGLANGVFPGGDRSVRRGILWEKTVATPSAPSSRSTR